jgi:hypothetical protein
MPLWTLEDSIKYNKKLLKPLFCEITFQFCRVQYFTSFTASGLCCTVTTKLCITDASLSYCRADERHHIEML